MSECLFCLHCEVRHTEEEYCTCDDNYHWSSYDYCTYYEDTLENLDIYRGEGCEHYVKGNWR